MIAQFHAGVEPHVESLDSFIHFARAIQLFLIHETNSWNILLAEGREQLCRHLGNVSGGHVIGVARRQVVDRDRDLPVRRSRSMAGHSHARECGQDYQSLHLSHDKVLTDDQYWC
jgi:hypothetical protein